MEKIKKVILTAFMMSLLLVLPAAAAETATLPYGLDYSGQPVDKDLGDIYKESEYFIGNEDYGDESIIATLEIKKDSVSKDSISSKIQYYDEESASWIDSDITITRVFDLEETNISLKTDAVDAEADIINKTIRIMTSYTVITETESNYYDLVSNEFVITANVKDNPILTFNTQPQSKDFGEVSKYAYLFIGNEDLEYEAVASVTSDQTNDNFNGNAVLKYYNTSSSVWIDTDINIEVRPSSENTTDFYFVIPDMIAGSEYVNKDLKIVLDNYYIDGKKANGYVESNTFVISCDSLDTDWIYTFQPQSKNLGEIAADSTVSLQNNEKGFLAQITTYNDLRLKESAILQYYNEETSEWIDSDVVLVIAETQIINDSTSVYTITASDILASADVINMSLRIVTQEGYTSNTFAVNCTYDASSTSFLTQPANKNVGHRNANEMVSINYSSGNTSGKIAIVSAATNVTMQYYDEISGIWKDSGVTFNLSQSGSKYSVIAPDVSAGSTFFNHNVRLMTADGKASNTFYLACNQYNENTLPDPENGMEEYEVYGYTAGDTIELVPNITNAPSKSTTTIRWQVSTNQGKSYSTLATIVSTDVENLVYELPADCAATGNYYRFAVNPSNFRASYSDPFEVIVYEDYEINNGTFTITNTGDSGKTNDYDSDSRLYGLRPWKNNLTDVKAVTFADSITELGNNICADMSNATKVALKNVGIIGDEVFSGCSSLKNITFPFGVDSIGKNVLNNTPALLEVVFENPNTTINSSKNTIPANTTDNDSPVATEKKKDLVANAHTYPVIYGYKGIALDAKNGLTGTSSGSTAYTYAVSNGLGFSPIGAIDSYGYERPIEWDYIINDGTVTNLSVKQEYRDNLIDANGIDLYIPKTVNGYKVTALAEIDYTTQDPICGHPEHEHTDECISYTCGLTEEPTGEVDPETGEEIEPHEHTDECVSYICGLDEHEHDEMLCYRSKTFLACEEEEDHIHDDACYTSASVVDIFGNFEGETRTVNITNIHIPDTVVKITTDSMTSLGSLQNVYNYSKEYQDWNTSLSTEYENVSMYTYSTNYNARLNSGGFDHVIFDIDSFTGTTGNLVWTLDLKKGFLSFTGNGSSADYTDISFVPYAWARHEINRITIGSGVTKLGDYVCAELEYLKSIINESSVLKTVSDTAFKHSGNSYTKGTKIVETHVNNPLFDAVSMLNKSYKTESSTSFQIEELSAELASLNEQIAALLESAGEELNSTDQKTLDNLEKAIEEKAIELEEKEMELENLEFEFVFQETTASCGNGITFTFDPSYQTLVINGGGIMTTFANNQNVPWRCVNEYIREIVIEKDVVSLSNYAFNGMTNLRTVYNYGKNQEINGGTDFLFDVINRRVEYTHNESCISYTCGMEKDEAHIHDAECITYICGNPEHENNGTIALIHVPKLGDTEDAYNLQVAEVMQTIKAYNLTITEQDIKGLTRICGIEAHSHNDLVCYEDGEFTCTKEEHVHQDICYEQTGTALVLAPGDYVISKTASTEQIMNIISGKSPDLQAEDYIVPVYSFGDENEVFNNAVPPKTDGYELMNIFKVKGQCGDNLTFYVSLDNELIIEGDGAMWNFEKGKSPWISAAGYITSIIYPDNITSIGDFAYEGIQMITKFELPNSITTIGKGAFKDCINLTSFNVDSNIEFVGEGLFAGCSSLRVVTSDNSDFYVTDGHFMNSDGTLLGFLRETLFADIENETLYENSSSYTVPDYISVIGAYAYYEADSFYSLYIPETVKEIHEYAFYNMDSLENIDSMAEFSQNVSGTFLEGCGTLYDSNDSKKYVILYKVNSDFETIASRQGYSIIYHDAKDVSYITATYTGGAIMIGKTFAKNNVNISIVYANGESENVYGTDSRISFDTMTITKLGDNFFHATYNDGYGQILQTNDFVVEGSDAVNSIEFSYTGSYVWYGEELERDYILAKLTSASGSMKSVNGNATYSTASGNKYCITLDKMTADKSGDIEFSAVYQDATSGSLSGTFKVRCLNYITGLAAQYSGHSVELAAGAAGIDLDALDITISWADGSVETVKGSDSRIAISSEYQTSGDNMIFEYTINDRNRYDKVGSFSCKYNTNLSSVDFDYVGAAITNGMTLSMADIQLTLHYSDGTSQKVTGDTVIGLEVDDMVIHTSDGTEEIIVTYVVAAQEFTGKIYVPGKVRTPVKLIVSKRPTKTVYQNGDVFDAAGMVVNCIYNNGVTENVTEKIQIDGGEVMTDDTKYVTLIYEDSSSGYTIQTQMSINVNQFQKTVSLQKSFKEQYEISKILFRSKKTEDLAEDGLEDTDNNGEIDEDEEDVGKWQDITPLLSYSSYDSDHQAADAEGNSLYSAPVIKAGYGFELKVFTKYRTNRAGSEFNAFMKKSQWDAEFESLYSTIDHDTFETRWKYLNDVYPQAAPTANPDIIYFRIVNSNLVDENGDPIKNLTGADGQPTDFLVMEKTNLTETNQEMDEGEWYNSTKVFEFPLRTIIDDEQTRRVYVSRDAANPNQKYTEYTMQIISPAWYGYDPEPYFSGNKFVYSTDEGETYANKSFAYSDMQTKWLHVCAEFTVNVTTNDDVHTHILE